MTTSVDTILGYPSVDLYRFEVRGTKAGFGNASTTGPVYDNTTYDPYSSRVYATGSFDSTDSSAVTNLVFSSPYGYLDASSLKVNDAVTIDGSSYNVTGLQSSNSFFVDKNADSTGSKNLTFVLGQREYLVEPDSCNNTSTGIASFNKNSTTITGSGTTWLADLAAGDFIKHDGYQSFYTVSQVLSNTSAKLSTAYTGDSTVGPYTSKKAQIGRELVQYIKDNFTYDKNSGKWKYDVVTGSDGTTSFEYKPLVDGIQLRFSDAVPSTFPDLMEISSVLNRTFAKETQYDAFQFPLPVVPNPESTLSLSINNQPKDMYPTGNRDYIVSYSPNPIYELPPPPDQRQIASVMMMAHVTNKSLSPSKTEDGSIVFTDSSNRPLNGIMPGSTTVLVDNTVQVPYRDYVLEPNSGVVDHVIYRLNEALTPYIMLDCGSVIDYGFNVYLNGVSQTVSFPPKNTDDVVFQPYTGRIKPQNKDKPRPGEVYHVSYQVEGLPIDEEKVQTVEASTRFRTSLWPIMRDSVYFLKNGVVLEEETDFHVSYQTGTVTLVTPMAKADVYLISYTPLAKLSNDLHFDAPSKTWYCTSENTRTKIIDPATFQVQIPNTNVNLTDGTVLRVFNESRDREYDLNGVLLDKQIIRLLDNTNNTSIGLTSKDTVLVDYRFKSRTLEYYPVVINNFFTEQGSNFLYLEGTDATSLFSVSSIVRMGMPDQAAQYYHFVDGATYDGVDTRVTLRTPAAESLTNVSVFVTDSTIGFLSVGLTAEPIMSGSTTVSFPGPNIKWNFRSGMLLKIDDELYMISGATYDHKEQATNVLLATSTVSDFTETSILSTIQYSDAPVYGEGDTEVTTQYPISTLVDIPGLIIRQTDTDIIPVVTYPDYLSVNGIAIDYTSNPTLSDVSSAIALSFPTLAVGTYIPWWPSRKITVSEDVLYLYKDFSGVLTVQPELRLDGTDSTNFEVSPTGGLVITDGLVRNQRYNFDYMGVKYLADSTVTFSADYFTKLPKKSKVVASFQFDNLDQFYIQVMSQRDFFEGISIPRMKEEIKQLNGNVGQGGDVASDEDQGNSSGGLSGDEYRRRDAEIECRVFKNIYDFFYNRVQAFGNELWAAEGPRLFNNDGYFTNAQEANATKPYNRIFQDFDYTNLEPMRVNPLTGEFRSYGAVFTNGSPTVTTVGNTWNRQLSDGTCFIGRADSTRRYRIQSISPTSMTLTENFVESTTSDTDQGEDYIASATIPLYDDDGNMGAKLIGSKSKNIRLSPGDVFDCAIDGVWNTWTVEAPPIFVDPIATTVMALSYLSSLSNPVNIASMLSQKIPALSANFETVLNPSKGNGYSSPMVLRTDASNYVFLGSGNAITKLGFHNYASSIGNLDRTTQLPETVVLSYEHNHILAEKSDLFGLLTTSNKVNRVNGTGCAMARDIYAHIGVSVPTYYQNEIWCVNREMNRLGVEIQSLGVIIQEPTISSYGDATTAYNKAVVMYNDTAYASLYDNSVYPSWEGKGAGVDGSWQWVLDFIRRQQIVKSIDVSQIAYDYTSGSLTPIDGQTTFVIQVPPGDDIRIPNAYLPNPTDTYYHPIARFSDNSAVIPGNWSGWSPAVANQYSINNTARFNLDETNALFVISTSSIPVAPSLITNFSSLNLSWTEDKGSFLKTFNYSTYPKVGPLTNAIDSVVGFGINYLSNCSGYDYTNLRIAAIPISGPPGTTVQTGPDSPALNIKYYTYYSTLSPTSMMVGGSTYSYASYPTMGDLSTAASSAYYSVVSMFASDYPTGGYIAASGDVSSVGTSIIRFNGDTIGFGVNFSLDNASYSSDSTGLRLNWVDGTVSGSSTIALASYPTDVTLRTVINSNPGFIATRYCTSTYDYTSSLYAASSSLTSTPITLLAGPYSKALRLASTNPLSTYSVDATALNLAWNIGTAIFPFAIYPTILSIVSNIVALPGWGGTSATYDAPVSYGTLMISSGSVTPSGVDVFFGGYIPVLNLSFNPNTPVCSAQASQLQLTFNDSVARTYNLPYSSYPTLQSLVDAVSTTPGFDGTFYNNAGSYVYEPLKVASYPLTSSFSPVLLKQNAKALELRASMPYLYCDTSSMDMTSPIGTVNSFPYSTYSTLNSLVTGLNTVYGVTASSIFDPSYSFGYLDMTAGYIKDGGTYVNFYYSNPAPLFKVFFDMQNIRYVVDSTSLNVFWEEDTTSMARIMRYTDYPTVSLVKGCINDSLNGLTGLDASGSPIYDSSSSRAFLIRSGPINPDATIYPALRPCFVDFQTISDRLLNNRTTFTNNRDSTVLVRKSYLDLTREPQIYSSVRNEQLLRSSDGGVGDVWIWANNRFNRRQGTEARLKQIENQIASNDSAKRINMQF